jgi:hypothetical protein
MAIDCPTRAQVDWLVQQMPIYGFAVGDPEFIAIGGECVTRTALRRELRDICEPHWQEAE